MDAGILPVQQSQFQQVLPLALSCLQMLKGGHTVGSSSQEQSPEETRTTLRQSVLQLKSQQR